MKKLIIACAAVLVLGLGLTTVGHVLGGQFYSVYYNGALHPFSDAAQNFSDKFVNISDHIVTADEDDDTDGGSPAWDRIIKKSEAKRS